MTEATAGPDLSALERVFAGIFIAAAAFSWVGILLAEIGAFTPGRVATGAVVLSAAALLLARRELRPARTPRAPRAPWPMAGLGAALAAGVVLTSQPGEHLIEGSDASVYLSVGHALQRTGGLVVADPVLRMLPAGDREMLFSRDRVPPRLLNRFPGGIQISDTGDLVLPNFFHLLPVWIALFVGGLGAHGGYYANVAFGALSILTVWLIGRRAWSAGAGAVAAMLLAINFGQVWHARTSSSELIAQWLVLAAVFFTLASRDLQSRVAAASAGTAVGLAGLARLDALVVLLPLGVAWAVLAKRRRLLGAAWTWYVVPLALVGGHALLHALSLSRPYTVRLAAVAWDSAARVAGAANPLVVAALAGAAAAALLAARLLRPRVRTALLATAVVAAPALVSPPVASTAAMLLTPVGAVAVGTAFALLVSRDHSRRLLPLSAPFAAEAILWLAWREKTAWPADFRRLVPVVLPIGLLLLAGLLAELGRTGAWARRLVPVLVAALAAAWLIQGWPVLRSPPMRGVHAQVARIAGTLPPRGILVTDRSAPTHLALAVQSAFGRPCLHLGDPVRARAALRRFVQEAGVAGRPVLVAVSDLRGDTERRFSRSDLEGLPVAFAGVVPLQYVSLAPSRTSFPRELRANHAEVELYEIGGPDPPPAALPLTIDIGTRDLQYLLGGFYAAESMLSARARWTGGEARIELPRIETAPGRPAALTLRIAAWRPAGLPPPVIRVLLDGVEIGSVVGPGSGFATCRFTLDDRALARLRSAASVLTIQTGTFVPKNAGQGDDTRILGVALDWIRLE